MSAHIPYGYRIVDGKAVIDEEKAEQLRLLFESCASGLSILESLRISKIQKTHRQAGKYLQDSKYLGTDYYPKIIDENVFNQAQQARKERNEKLRKGGWRKQKKDKKPGMTFSLGEIPERYTDPFEQASFAYELIERVDENE